MEIPSLRITCIDRYIVLTVDELKNLIPSNIKRLCLFASYSDNPELENSYHYCNELKNYFDLVIIITNERIISKIPDKCKVIFTPNFIIDFGRWWRILSNLKSSRDGPFEMIGLINDSCEIIASLNNVFKKGLESKSEFWGMTDGELTEGGGPPWHIQSYFLIFQDSAINLLDEFVQSHRFENITEPNRYEIIDNLEIGLSQYLKDKVKSYVIYPIRSLGSVPSPFNSFHPRANPSYQMWDKLLISGCPLLKKKRVHYDEEEHFIKYFKRIDHSLV